MLLKVVVVPSMLGLPVRVDEKFVSQ